MSHAVADPHDALPRDLRALARPPRWLQAAADAPALIRALTRRVPEIASGDVALKACEVRQVRIKRDVCAALYRVRVSDGEAAPDRVVELHGEVIPPGRRQPRATASGTFGSPEWRCGLPELGMIMTTESPDTALRALPALTDPGAAGELVERAIRSAAARYAGFRVESCRPRVARYKPGSRCTIVYDLDLGADAPATWPRAVVAKTYHGDKGRTAFDGMRALWASPLRRASVTIAEPLGFLPAENVLMQRFIPHRRTLKDLLGSSLAAGGAEALADLASVIEQAAHGLAALHRSGVDAARTVTWDDEVAATRELIRRLTAVVPSLAGSAQNLLDAQARVAAAHPAQPPVAAHGSFRPAQVVLDDAHRIGFIDFDGFCMAEPAMDVALFRATLRDAGLRALEDGSPAGDREARRGEHLALLEVECDRFLAAYERVVPISRPRVALWETTEALVAVLHCWTKVKFDRLPYRLAVLQHQLPETET